MNATRCWVVKAFASGKQYMYETYFTEDEAIWRVASILNSINAVDILNDGYFDYTTFLGEKFLKLYVLECYAPGMKFIIQKKSRGEINKRTFTYKLRKFKREFNEENKI